MKTSDDTLIPELRGRSSLTGPSIVSDRPSKKVETSTPLIPALALIDAHNQNFLTGRFDVLFERQAALTPDHVALQDEDERLSYRELNERANQLAHYLQKLGVGPESAVGVFVERGRDIVDTMVAILGIFKAGSAYVMLNSAYPPSWISFAIRDSGVCAILTFQRLSRQLEQVRTRLDEDGSGRFAAVYLDLEGREIQCHSSGTPQSGATIDNLAYVIYTSGTSSGVPKGVLVEHRWLGLLAKAHIDLLKIQPADHVLQHLWLGFDASVIEYATAWLAGATLHPVPAPALDPGPALTDFLIKRGITVMYSTPSILQAVPSVDSTSLRSIVAGGETCPPELARRLTKGGKRVFTAYGLTETVGCNLAGVWSDEGDAGNLGTPFDYVNAELWDEKGNQVPAGQSGEIVISGPLARGYTDPSLTASRFIYHGAAGTRYFLTGDRARRNLDGTFTFEGRLDSETKVGGGYRVDLHAIESTLRKHPSNLVTDCAVILRSDNPDNWYVAAYLVSKEPEKLSVASLPSYMKEQLPPYMLPAAYVVLSFLPLGMTGKRSANSKDYPVPQPTDWVELTSEIPVSGPSTEVETMLARMVLQLKGSPQNIETQMVDVSKSLKDLRVDSRKVVTFMVRVAQTFGVRLEIGELAVSLRELAGIIEQRKTR